MWQTLGCAPKALPRNSKKKQTMSESNHVESALEMLDLDEEEGNDANAMLSEAQDLHAV